MNLAEQLLKALKGYWVKEIFGIPGDFALPLFKVIEETAILPLYTLSHEPAVGFAADAAARFHTRPSVAVTLSPFLCHGQFSGGRSSVKSVNNQLVSISTLGMAEKPATTKIPKSAI